MEWRVVNQTAGCQRTKRSRHGSWISVCLFGLAVFVMRIPANAEEPFGPFLDGLRQRGYFEVALEYLTDMETSPLASESQRTLIPYERARTLVAYSRTQRDIERRLQILGQGEKQLQQFVNSQSTHPKAFAARSELANMIVERARINLEQAKSDNSERFVQQARKQFLRAIEELETLRSVVAAQLETIPKVLDTRDRKEAALAQRRTQLRADNLQTELLAAAIREELAGTFEPGSDEHEEQLTAAAAQYDSIYKNYRSRLAGLYARMYQGRCNAQMGKTKDALAYYGDLLDQPNEPEDMQRLKTEALRLAMDCWLSPNERKYLEAIKQATRWMEIVPRRSQRGADMLAIRLSLARAYQMQAEDFSRRGMNQSIITQSLLSARDQAEFVANEEGPLRESAQALAEELGSQRLESGPTEPTTFAEATQVGREALDQIGPANGRVLQLQQQLRASGGDTQDLRDQLATALKQLETQKTTALESYQLAMAMVDSSTPPTDLALARYFLCYLHYLNGDHMRAAAVGEFVARNHPGSDAGLPCAKIALVCYNALLDAEGEGNDIEFELARLFELTRYLADTWPTSPDAVQVLASGVPTMANAGDHERARVLTEMIPEDASARWQADFITGQAIRREYFDQKSKQDAATEPLNEESTKQLQSLADASREFLLDGFRRLPDEPTVDRFNVSTMLLTAEALLDNSQSDLAVQVLEHPTLGPMTLIDANDPIATDPLLYRQALQLALRAYVGSIDEGDSMLDKARATMLSLRNAIGVDDVGKQQMLAVYVQLARSIEQQIKSAEEADKQRLSKVFESFLTELAGESNDSGVLLWVADTYVSLGSGLDEDPNSLPPMAKQYYAQAATALENLLAQPSLDAALRTQIRARLATVKSLQQDYAGALNDYGQLLRAQPNAVNVQVEAARTLSRWGKTDPTQWERAIRGVGTNSTRTIWGWAKIASATMSHKELRGTFYEARYEAARCGMERAKSQSGSERARSLAEASRTLRTTRTLYPALADTKWAPLYSSLEEQIDALR